MFLHTCVPEYLRFKSRVVIYDCMHGDLYKLYVCIIKEYDLMSRGHILPSLKCNYCKLIMVNQFRCTFKVMALFNLKMQYIYGVNSTVNIIFSWLSYISFEKES